MSWGAPIQAPMVMPPEPGPSQYMEPAPEFEKMDAVGTSAMRLADKIAMRTKAMPRIHSKTSLDTGKAAETAEYMGAMRQAFGITRGQNKVSNLRAKAKAKAVQRQIDTGNRQYKRTGSKLSSRTTRAQDQIAMQHARNVLGMGTDTFKNVRL